MLAHYFFWKFLSCVYYKMRDTVCRWSSYFLNSYSGLFNVVKVVSGIHGKMAIALLWFPFNFLVMDHHQVIKNSYDEVDKIDVVVVTKMMVTMMMTMMIMMMITMMRRLRGGVPAKEVSLECARKESCVGCQRLSATLHLFMISLICYQDFHCNFLSFYNFLCPSERFL